MTEQTTEPNASAALENVMMAAITEQRRKRRWSIFFRLVFLCIFFSFLAMLFMPESQKHERGQAHTALIDVEGMIAQSESFNADNVAASLRAAFDDKQTKGIILRINSPGGTPVQSAYIFDEIKRLQAKYPKVPVYAVCTDVCASGAYYVAAAANKIYANPASIIGSIGVLMNGFGFEEVMKKIGIERRLITAGKYKGFLDPFSPKNEKEKAIAKIMLNQVHTQFIAAVKLGRGTRLKSNPDLFTGLVWTGEEALTLGLIDGFGSTGYVAREVIKAPNIIDYTVEPDYFSKLSRLFGVTQLNQLWSAQANKLLLQ